jgi:host factor-I protein
MKPHHRPRPGREERRIAMNKGALNLQDAFLNQLRKENVPVTVYLINGFQIKGLVKSFDSYTVFLEQDGRQQLVFKHAISTITPAHALALNFLEQGDKE